MRFCPTCGSRLPADATACQRCGTPSLGDIDDGMLSDLERILKNEIAEQRRQLNSERTMGTVVDINDETIGLQLESPSFEEGDAVGYISGGSVLELGPVMVGGSSISIKLGARVNLTVGENVELVQAENLIASKLQLDLLKRIRERKMGGREKKAVEIVLREEKRGTSQDETIRRLELEDTRGLDGSFQFDPSQIEAIGSILGLLEGELLLIIGPPGTGKTKVIAKAAYELSRTGSKVLICSHTNRAVDNVIENLPVEKTLRIGRPEKVTEQVRPYTLSFKGHTALGLDLLDLEGEIRQKRNELDRLFERGRKHRSQDRRAHEAKITTTKRELARALERRYSMFTGENSRLLKESKIVGCTLVRSALPPLDDELFDVVMIDESSQASVTLALLGMVRAKRWVLIGDHKQLLPIFRTVYDPAMIQKLSCFSSLLAKYPHRSLWLRRHYRSNSEIIRFSARFVYDDNITSADSCRSIKLEVGQSSLMSTAPTGAATGGGGGERKRTSTTRPLGALNPILSPSRPVVFVDVDGYETSERGGSYSNESEEQATVLLVNQLKRSLFLESSAIGIITPYRAQRDRLRSSLQDEAILVDTVDSFQGREKDVIILSLVATRNRTLSFVSDPNRLNVAITRARRKLIVVGNAKSILVSSGLQEDNLLLRFARYARENGNIFYWKNWLSAM